MPADKASSGPIKAMIRLFSVWRQRRAARRRAPFNSFMSLSDLALADIGVRRADVHGAMLGAAPLRQSATALEPAPDSAICQLPQRPRLTVVSNDLDAAA
jgi:uncharacterized protein YjiS (DUF1127 family)